MCTLQESTMDGKELNMEMPLDKSPPIDAWRAFPANSDFSGSSAAARRLNSGFDARRKKATIPNT